MIKFIRNVFVAAVAIAMVGCEGGGDSNAGPYGSINSKDSDSKTSSSKEVNNDIVGSWSLTENGTENVWYIHFSGDNTWRITDDSSGSELRVYGSYTCKDQSFSGSMINPGVGEGEIAGSISEGAISLDFTEFWHEPHKVVKFSGNKL